MILYEYGEEKLLDEYLEKLYEEYPSIHLVLLSPSKEGKAPIKEWKNHRPSLSEVRAHLGERKRIGIKPNSIGQFVIDVDHAGKDSLPNLRKHFPFEDENIRKHCLHSGTAGKYHIWLPVSQTHPIKTKEFSLTENLLGEPIDDCKGDLIYDHYIVWHHPTQLYLDGLIKREKFYSFDKEITEFKNKFMKAAKSEARSEQTSVEDSEVVLPPPAPIVGLSLWGPGVRHNSTLSALQLITNTNHYKNHDAVTSYLSDVDIEIIIHSKSDGYAVAAHALHCGAEREDVWKLLRDHLIEMKKHIKNDKTNKEKAPRKYDPMKAKLLDMSDRNRFEYMLKESNIELKWDVSRDLWEVNFNDGKGIEIYNPDSKDDNFLRLRGDFRDNFPGLGRYDDSKGYNMPEPIWWELHSWYKRQKHNQRDSRSDYFFGEGDVKSLIESYKLGELTEEIEEYMETARSYFEKSLDIKGSANIAYARRLAAFFFEEYAMCMLNVKHRSKLLIILIGKKDVGKSTYVESLIPKEWQPEGRKFYTEIGTDKGGSDWMKETGLATQGCIGLELTEIKLGKNTPLKSLIGSNAITYRKLYDSNVTRRGRNFWMMGTANHLQANLSATDMDWVEKFAFLNVKKFTKDSQGFADRNLRKAIIGGYFLNLERDKKMGHRELTHPFIEDDGTESYKKWKQMTYREVGTFKERQYADDIREMMLASCKKPSMPIEEMTEDEKRKDKLERFCPTNFKRSPLSIKMKLLDIVEAVEAHKLWRESGYNTEAPERYHKVYALKPNKDTKLISSALSIVGWKKVRTRICNKWQLEDVSGFWAKKGFAELASESQQEQEE